MSSILLPFLNLLGKPELSPSEINLYQIYGFKSERHLKQARELFQKVKEKVPGYFYTLASRESIKAPYKTFFTIIVVDIINDVLKGVDRCTKKEDVIQVIGNIHDSFYVFPEEHYEDGKKNFVLQIMIDGILIRDGEELKQRKVIDELFGIINEIIIEQISSTVHGASEAQSEWENLQSKIKMEIAGSSTLIPNFAFLNEAISEVAAEADLKNFFKTDKSISYLIETGSIYNPGDYHSWKVDLSWVMAHILKHNMFFIMDNMFSNIFRTDTIRGVHFSAFINEICLAIKHGYALCLEHEHHNICLQAIDKAPIDKFVIITGDELSPSDQEIFHITL